MFCSGRSPAVRRKLAAAVLAVASAFSFSAAQAYRIDIGYIVGASGPGSVLFGEGYVVFYVCSDNRPYQGTEKCPGDVRLVVVAANKPIYKKR